MLYIDPDTKIIQDSIEQHYESIKCIIRKKVGISKKCSNINCQVCPSDRFIVISPFPSTIKKFIDDDIDFKALITEKPEDLLLMHNVLMSEVFESIGLDFIAAALQVKQKNRSKDEHFLVSYYNTTIRQISKVFDYENWFLNLKPSDNYSSYHLADNLNRRSCTYCNRTYTTTMKSSQNGKLMRPQFDHWFPKTKYPLLSLSFFNLIPSCSICNSSSKGDTELNLDVHLHPYLNQNQTNEFSFNFIYNNSLDKFHVFIKSDQKDKKAHRTLKELQIDTMYNAHHTELSDLIKIKQAYSDNYINNISDLFPKSPFSKDEIYRLLFGTELESENFHKRPLSKFKSDILKELGIIKD